MKNETLNLKNFFDWVLEQPSEEGSRNSTVVKIVREGLGQGFSKEKLQEAVGEYCKLSGLDITEAIQILGRHEKEHAINPFSSNQIKNGEDGFDWIALVYEFLSANFKGPEGFTLVQWNGDYYVYHDGYYQSIEDSFLLSKISEFYIKNRFRLKKIKLSKIQQEMRHILMGMIMLHKDKTPPFLLPSKPFIRSNQIRRDWLCLQNGILDVTDYLNGVSDPLMCHTQSFFCLNKIPYNFDPNAQCPTWQNFLNSTFDDQEIIKLVQEWFGYNLVPHNKYQKFFLAEGQGSNGKSVLLKVLSLMLGEGNFASVGLESFDPKRSYALAHLAGVMANIVNDLNEVDKTGEGLLKQFVAGEPITVERKFKDHFTMIPTAKLTLATNVLPKFVDRSDGIWRRLIKVSFKKQILDESKQDKRLMSDEWWMNSGELSGVLNWALEGLKRLEERKSFKIPDSVKEEINKYRLDSNAAATFLNTHFVEDKDSDECTHLIYHMYRNFCSRNGYRTLTAHNFAAEVKRIFPGVTASATPKYYEVEGQKYVKSRAWIGLKRLPLKEQPENPFT